MTKWKDTSWTLRRLVHRKCIVVCFFMLLIPLAPVAAQLPHLKCAPVAFESLPNVASINAEDINQPVGLNSDPHPPWKAVKQFCRVVAVVQPTRDSHIEVEIWLPPLGRWNGNLYGVGSGGLGGIINRGAMLAALSRGYATVATDTGHGNLEAAGTFAFGHPDRVADYGFRSIHLAAILGKSVVKIYYGMSPRYSYFSGCSQGGQEGLMEAQRFPLDYDGIVAGDADYNQTHHEVGAHLWVTRTLFASPDSRIPPGKVGLIGDAVNDACDTLDGVKDGVLEDPRGCHFDPGVLQCKSADGPNCLTASQVEAVRRLWDGPRENLGASYYPGLERGGEAETWHGWIVSDTLETNVHAMLGLPFFKYFMYGDPDWDFRTFNFKLDWLTVDQRLASILNASNPDLRPFLRRGGKLIQYHGFSDPDVPPRTSIDYYNAVEHTVRNRALILSSYRLFMVPGMGHCGGGPGANYFDMMPALSNWVEHHRSPDRIIATKYVDDDPSKPIMRTHPLCPYPQIAWYKGSGNPSYASSFVCRSTK